MNTLKRSFISIPFWSALKTKKTCRKYTIAENDNQTNGKLTMPNLENGKLDM